MKASKNNTFIQFLWIIGILLVSYVSAITTLNLIPGNSTLDFAVNGSPVHPIGVFTILFFIPLIFLTFFIKESRRRFARGIPTAVVLISGMILVYAIGLISVAIAKNEEMLQSMLSGSETSVSYDDTSKSVAVDKLPKSHIASAGILVQVVLSACLLCVAYYRGKHIGLQKNASSRSDV